MIWLWMIAPTAVVFVVLHVADLAAAGRWAARRLGLVASAPLPAGPPIERIAADLRRLGARIDRLRAEEGLPHKALRVRAAELAYGDRLADACTALGVDHALDRSPLPTGERARVEAALAAAGLAVGLRPDPRR